MTIKFDFNPLLRELNALEKVKLPTAARRSLYETGRYLREFHRREMAGTFRDPVPFTLRSPRYRVDPQRLELTMSISTDGTLGQTPADYLAPVFRTLGSNRGTVITSRFAKQLARAGHLRPGTHLVPQPGAALAQTRRGRLSPAMYAQALAGIKGANLYASARPKLGANSRWFVISPDDARSYLEPGVYRAQGRRISRIWAALDSAPSVARTYDWIDSTISEAQDQIEARIARYVQF
jgi:hypothetical protein